MKLTPLIPVAAVALAAGILRLPELDRRPMHADEAVQADKFGTLVETGRCAYDPKGYHGTALAYLTLAPAMARRQWNYLALDETTLRLTPAVASLLLALTPFLLAGALDRTALWLAAALIAVSPAFVYYGRYYVPETLLVLFNALAIAAGWRFVRTRAWPWAAAAGVALGLMYATKETALIAFAGLAIACGSRLRAAGYRALLIGAAAAAGSACLLLSSFFLNPAGPLDSLRSLFVTYLGQAFQDPLHRHGWGFYFGVLAYEWPVLVLCAAGVWRAWVEREPFLRFACVYTLVMAAVYCALPYKTPWCALNFWFPLLLVAGAGASWLVRAPEVALRVANAVVLTVGFANLSWQAWSRSVADATGPDNPYAYAHTTPDVFLVRDRIGQLARAHADGERMAIQVFSTQNLWPLPWYLRRYPNVRWWRAVPEKDPIAPVVLLTPDFEPALSRRLYELPPPGQRELYMNIFERALELRPGVELRGFAKKSLWDLAR